MIIALAGKTNKSISVFDWGNTGYYLPHLAPV